MIHTKLKIKKKTFRKRKIPQTDKLLLKKIKNTQLKRDRRILVGSFITYIQRRDIYHPFFHLLLGVYKFFLVLFFSLNTNSHDEKKAT